MQNFWKWLLESSADPTKVALTVQGTLGVIASMVVALSPMFHLHVGSEQLNVVVDSLVQIVVIGTGLVSGFAAMAGFARKIFFIFHQQASDPLVPMSKRTS